MIFFALNSLIYYLLSMLKKFSDLLFKNKTQTAVVKLVDITADKEGKAVSQDAIVSIAALLVFLATSDDQVAKEEAEAICLLLAYNLNLADDLIPQVVQNAVERRRTVGKIEDIAATINSTFSIEQRIRILAMCWKLIFSDNKLEKLEERMLVKISTSLYLSIEQQQKARFYAEEGLV